ncbi:hypothetical protein FRB93_013115 [Tulasnella sp. JGI-2019a]|nr:hypothetical protein FRB93_013115 [Tulasnella sp. JGI-2019a]
MIAKTYMIIAALAAAATAQNATTPSYNTTFVTGLAQYLGSLGLTSLAGAVQSSINSTGTINLLNNINGTGKTLLAPTNTAFTGFKSIYPNATTNPNLLGDIISYHLLSGSYPGSVFSTFPNHTVARTYMNDSAVVQLEGSKPQAMVFAIQDNKTHILNQNTNVTITNTTSYQNLLIHIVDAVVDLPGNFTNAAATYQLTSAQTAINSLGLADSIRLAHGQTLFVPDNTAFSNANATITQLITSNVTQAQAVLSNHIINGSTIYSTELASAHANSIGGQGFTFASNSSGFWVTSGASTAKVVVADILLDNGVMHIIDSVLFNNNTNLAAATSAYSTATAAAATNTAIESGPIGNNVGNSASGTSGSSSSSNSKSAGNHAVPIFTGANGIQALVALVGVFAGAAILI